MASSPVREIDRTSALGTGRGRDSGFPGLIEKDATGLPSQAAPRTIVWPSGAKRAVKIWPRRKVSLRYDGSGALPERSPSTKAAAATPARTAIAARNRRRWERRGRAGAAVASPERAASER